MEESGLKSSFQFKAYKVDKLNFYSKPDLHVLAQMNNIPPELMNLGFSFREPLYFSSEKFYVGGFDLVFKVTAESLEPATEDDILIKLELGIAGVFRIEDGRLSKEQEDDLVKTSIPTILLPYARSAMTSFLANAGFGAAIFPLVNVYELAKVTMKDKTIKVVE